MSSITKAARSAIQVHPWQLIVAQVLEEHHLCATSDAPVARARFAHELVAQLSLMQGSQVCLIDGTRTHDARSFGAELASALGIDTNRHAVDSVDGVIWALRRRFSGADEPNAKRRFIIWTESHELLRDNASLFDQLADAMMGVAAEGEFVSEDLLLLQRCVFVGRTALDMYAEDPAAQFRCWLREGSEEPLWGIVSGQSSPRVKRARIESDGHATILEPASKP